MFIKHVKFYSRDTRTNAVSQTNLIRSYTNLMRSVIFVAIQYMHLTLFGLQLNFVMSGLKRCLRIKRCFSIYFFIHSLVIKFCGLSHHLYDFLLTFVSTKQTPKQVTVSNQSHAHLLLLQAPQYHKTYVQQTVTKGNVNGCSKETIIGQHSKSLQKLEWHVYFSDHMCQCNRPPAQLCDCEWWENLHKQKL